MEQEPVSFLDVDTSGAVEPKAVPAGEYKVRWIGGSTGINKNNNPYFQPLFEVPSEANSKSFTDYIPLPHEGMTEKEHNDALWRMDCFKKCFGYKQKDKINLQEDPPKEGWMILGIKDDPEYGEQNTRKKYILPK